MVALGFNTRELTPASSVGLALEFTAGMPVVRAVLDGEVSRALAPALIQTVDGPHQLLALMILLRIRTGRQLLLSCSLWGQSAEIDAGFSVA